MFTLYKYQGAGNDFLVADNRDGRIDMSPQLVSALCHRRYGIGADGLMLLEQAPEGYGFRMVYFNSDGSGGMMCGNGGRCIVAFAHRCGLPVHRFLAPDGPHRARILSADGPTMAVSLMMRDVDAVSPVTVDAGGSPVSGFFLDTGTRHFVVPVHDIDAVPVVALGRELRRHPAFAPLGVNVNFMQMRSGTLHVRTYEKGVEDETYACGTGITAAAIASSMGGQASHPAEIHVPVKALRDSLAVDFTPTRSGASHVWLTGPAAYVATISNFAINL